MGSNINELVKSALPAVDLHFDKTAEYKLDSRPGALINIDKPAVASLYVATNVIHRARRRVTCRVVISALPVFTFARQK